jgi:salicylate hydroxylase
MGESRCKVAIVGGGLCGLGLAIALEKRNISYTIYELQSNFSEIGSGLNVAPNAIAAFNLIQPGLGQTVSALGTRNSPDMDVWMVNRLGAPTESFPDGYDVTRIIAPGVGHTAVGRYELLNLLASKINVGNARFNKKLARVEQDISGAKLYFEDGTEDFADIVIGSDGVHSVVRKSLLASWYSPAAFTGMGGYRFILTMEQVVSVLGPDMAKTSCIWSGPGGYVTMYSIEEGAKVNFGLWTSKENDRARLEKERWVLKNQTPPMLDDFKNWGPSLQGLMSLAGEQTQLWTSHHFDAQIDSYYDGRLCVIGDAAHAMGPHLGQGASQAMEDAYVMAEVLAQIDDAKYANIPLSTRVTTAFRSWQDVRKPQFEWLCHASHEAYSFWAGLWRYDLTKGDLEQHKRDAAIKLDRVWNANIGRQGEVAASAMGRTFRHYLAA